LVHDLPPFDPLAACSLLSNVFSGPSKLTPGAAPLLAFSGKVSERISTFGQVHSAETAEALREVVVIESLRILFSLK
jgi:hypothetical protein